MLVVSFIVFLRLFESLASRSWARMPMLRSLRLLEYRCCLTDKFLGCHIFADAADLLARGIDKENDGQGLDLVLLGKLWLLIEIDANRHRPIQHFDDRRIVIGRSVQLMAVHAP